MLRQRQQFRVFFELLQLVPGLRDRLLSSGTDDIAEIAELVCFYSCIILRAHRAAQIQKGSAGARSDDTKSIKGPIIDWITPSGEPLRPLLARNMKMDRGFHHERTGLLLCPVELDWNDPEYALSPRFPEAFSQPHSVKQGLRSGELGVSGDQWPLFLFAGYKFNPEDPWDGLFRSPLLLCVCTYIDKTLTGANFLLNRLLNISSHLQVQ